MAEKGLTLLPTGAVTLQQLLDVIYEQRFTGTTVVHFRGGVACFVDTGRPIRIELKTPPRRSGLTQENRDSHTSD